MHYVNAKALERGHRLEKKLSDFPPHAGICFVAVQPVPAEDGDSGVVDVFVGLSVNLEPSVGRALVDTALATIPPEDAPKVSQVFAAVGILGRAAELKAVNLTPYPA